MKDNENKTADTAGRKPDVKMDFSLEVTGTDAEAEKAKDRALGGCSFLLLMSAACLVSAVFDLVNVFSIFIILWGVALGVWLYRLFTAWRKEGFGRFPRWWGGL